VAALRQSLVEFV